MDYDNKVLVKKTLACIQQLSDNDLRHIFNYFDDHRRVDLQPNDCFYSHKGISMFDIQLCGNGEYTFYLYDIPNPDTKIYCAVDSICNSKPYPLIYSDDNVQSPYYKDDDEQVTVAGFNAKVNLVYRDATLNSTVYTNVGFVMGCSHAEPKRWVIEYFLDE